MYYLSPEISEENYKEDFKGRRYRNIAVDKNSCQDEFVADSKLVIPRYLITFENKAMPSLEVLVFILIILIFLVLVVLVLIFLIKKVLKFINSILHLHVSIQPETAFNLRAIMLCIFGIFMFIF